MPLTAPHWDLQVTWINSPPLNATYMRQWDSIGSDNGLSPIRRQAIILTNDVFLSIGPLGTNLSEIWVKTQTFHSRKCV